MTEVKHYRVGDKYLGAFAGHVPEGEDIVECPAPMHAKSLWLDDQWVIPEDLTIETLLLDNNVAYEQATSMVTGDYPQMEKDTWPTQDKESRSWLIDPINAKTPWIDRASSIRNISREEYLRRTLVKSYQFNELSAHFTGLRQYYEDIIKSGVSPTFDYSIPLILQQELQQHAYFIMTAPVEQLQEAYT